MSDPIWGPKGFYADYNAAKNGHIITPSGNPNSEGSIAGRRASNNDYQPKGTMSFIGVVALLALMFFLMFLVVFLSPFNTENRKNSSSSNDVERLPPKYFTHYISSAQEPVFIRDEQFPTGNIIGEFEQGACFESMGVYANLWHRFELPDDSIGYVSGQFIRPVTSTSECAQAYPD